MIDRLHYGLNLYFWRDVGVYDTVVVWSDCLSVGHGRIVAKGCAVGKKLITQMISPLSRFLPYKIWEMLLKGNILNLWLNAEGGKNVRFSTENWPYISETLRDSAKVYNH